MKPHPYNRSSAPSVPFLPRSASSLSARSAFPTASAVSATNDAVADFAVASHRAAAPATPCAVSGCSSKWMALRREPLLAWLLLGRNCFLLRLGRFRSGGTGPFRFSAPGAQDAHLPHLAGSRNSIVIETASLPR